MADFLVRGPLKKVDPDVYELIQYETARQAKKIIMIPSESTAPVAVREGLGSVFQNIYAEGYAGPEILAMSEPDILDADKQLTHYRRYSDPRYYKGVEYVDMVEALAARRCAEAFATKSYPAELLFVNVQPLSGAPANNAVYTALVTPGDTVLGMNLNHGGHLTHGSSVNRSGKLFNAVHYSVDPKTELIDYDNVQALANEHKPKIIIAGYSSYPWVPNWKRFREIADSVGAYFLADVSHIAGLIAAGVIPSPIGYAHVVTFTTHKTLMGPRSACIITTSKPLATKIDRAVFPGEQGGPHIHAVAALATMYKIAQTQQFKRLQKRILDNCLTLADQLQKRGLRLAFGGTNLHLLNIDLRSIKGPDGTTLSGDMAARILDIAGVVVNRNTIPGDIQSARASGIRMGTPWISQRGFDKQMTTKLADVIADVLLACEPYSIETKAGKTARAKIDFDVLEKAKLRILELSDSAGRDLKFEELGYPHWYFLTDKPKFGGKTVSYSMTGDHVRHFAAYVFGSDTEALALGKSQKTELSVNGKTVKGTLTLVKDEELVLTLAAGDAILTSTWLRDLSDGYIHFDADPKRRIPGPIVIKEIEPGKPIKDAAEAPAARKPYFINKADSKGKALPAFKWDEKEGDLKRTPLFETHQKLGAKMVPFAGWEMPVWYTSVVEEHTAVRQAAGLFDVAHMGVYQAEGPDACLFLDSVCGNDITTLAVGESLYTHFLDQDANVIDDLLVYRRRPDMYLVVVNASNDDKDWTWLNGVLKGKFMVDREQPDVQAFGRNVTFRNLRDRKAGDDMRVDIALQGRKSRDILLALGCSPEDKAKIMGLKRTELCEAVVGGLDLVVSRTGYTGENMAFELFVHPDKSVELWDKLMAAGTPLGMLPCGLGARDSLRTEFGLPLYGHEMAGDTNYGVADAGFGSYVKTSKPWFIGRNAFLEQLANQTGVIVRFRFDDKRVRMSHNGDPVLDAKGKVIGRVTSCAIDSEGYLTGQAFVELKSAEEGTVLYIYQGASDKPGKAPAEMKTGDRITLPSMAVVVSRFAKLK